MGALGRAAGPAILSRENPDFRVVEPSAVPLTGSSVVPHTLTIAEIEEYVELYRNAAQIAVDEAGFDGVEFHMANGFLLDQFLQDTANIRTDKYGNSVENRCRFPLEAIAAVVDTIGQERTALRISPWSTFQGKGLGGLHRTALILLYFQTCECKIRSQRSLISFLVSWNRIPILHTSMSSNHGC